MRKIRAYIAPTRSNPNRAIVGVPDNVQLDDTVASISLTQQAVAVVPTPLVRAANPQINKNPAPIESLASPTSPVGKSKGFLDGALQKIQNKPISAGRSIGITDLTPGLTLKASPILGAAAPKPGALVAAIPLLPPIEVEEVVLPGGFVPMEDMTKFELFKYNKANVASDAKFESLPGRERVPKLIKYDLVYADNEFSYTTNNSDFVTEVGVYWRRKSKLKEDYEWTKLGQLASPEDTLEWNLSGEYVFRAAPMHFGNPIDGFKEYELSFPEEEGLFWTYCQLAPGVYNVRFEGNIGTKINLVKLYEDGRLLKSIPLEPDAAGRVEIEFTLKGVSLDDSPEIKLNFLRKLEFGDDAFYFSETLELQKNYAVEPISMRVRLIKEKDEIGRDRNIFDINILDKNKQMYNPKTSIEPFSGDDWVTAIQRKKTMVLLEINRIQDGLKTEYGQFYVNISQEKDPNFLEAAPFNADVKRIQRGFSFRFEDTEEFRKILELDSPDLDKRLAYEFRLVFWSCGIDEALRNDAEYIFVKQVPINVNNKKGFYKYAYNSWKLEHPQSKYFNVTPLGVEHKDFDKHLEFGRSVFGSVISVDPIPPRRTNNINVQPVGWKVLYFPDDVDDTVKEIPYYQFLIGIPATTQDHVHSVKVFVGKEDKVQIGTYHPCDTLNIIDFLGHYKYRNEITKKIDFRKAIKPEKEVSFKGLKADKIPDFKQSTMTGLGGVGSSAPAMLVEPAKQVSKTAKKSFSRMASSLNRMIGKKIAGNSFIEYEIVVEFSNGQKMKRTHYAPLSGIPQIPEEPDDNVSFSLGNPTISKDFIDNAFSPVVNKSVMEAIEKFEIPKATTIPVSTPAGISNSGVFEAETKAIVSESLGANLGKSPPAVAAVATNNQPSQVIIPEAQEAVNAAVPVAQRAFSVFR